MQREHYRGECMHGCEESVSGNRLRLRLCANQLLLMLAAWVAVIVAATLANAEGGTQATTAKSARLEAMRAIPMEKVDTRYRSAVKQVLNDSSLYRRLPTQTFACEPKLFTYMMQNPESLVEIWRRLGITRIELKRIGGSSFRLTDNSGTTGKLTIVEQNCDDRAQNRIVMYGEGAYEGKPFRRPVKAQCVLLLRSGSMKETNDRDYVAARLDTFIHIDRASIELFAKAVHPLVGKTADRNFTDTLQFISSFSHAAETRPETVERLVSGLPDISQESQNKLIQIAYQCGIESSDEERSRRK